MRQQEAFQAFGFFGGADLPAMEYKLVGKFGPLGLRHQVHQIEFDFYRITVGGQAQSLGDPTDVSIHDNSGDTERVAQNDIGGFATNTRQFYQLLPAMAEFGRSN